MATIKSIIRRKGGKPIVNEAGQTLIYVQYVHNSRTVLFSTNVKIDPECWNDKKQIVDSKKIYRRVTATASLIKELEREDTITNAHLDSLKSKIRSIVRRFQLEDKDPDVWQVKAEFENQYLKPKVIKTFYNYLDEYIKDGLQIKSRRTIQYYENLGKQLKTFEKLKKEPITFQKIDHRFYDKFVNYLLSEVVLADKSIGMMNNSVGSLVKVLKSFLAYLEKRGVEVNPAYKSFKVFKENPLVVYLTQEELKHLYSLELEDERLDKVRDLFVLQCSTGLRYSDLKRLGREHIYGTTIKMKAHKTKKDVIVPLTPVSSAILSKYNYELPSIFEQKQNEYLKELGKIAGLNSIVEIPVYRGARKEYEKYYKFQLMTTHIGVKTFITHAGELGMSAKTVSEITGKSVKVILDHYWGTDNRVIEMEMKRAFGAVESQLKVG